MNTKYRILTWNILANGDYETRLPRIIDYIKSLKPDIILLQETLNDYNEQATELWKAAGYAYKAKPGTNSIHGVGVACNEAKFYEYQHGEQLTVDFPALSIDLLPVGKQFEQREPKYVTSKAPHPDSPVDYGNDVLTVVSYHGKWGAFSQPQRLAETMRIDDFAKNKGNSVILGGDFNAMPYEPAIEYLRGNYIVDDKASYWVEAQELVEQLNGEKPHATSLTHGEIFSSINRFDMTHMIERRIDFLFNFGFSYGRQYAFDGQPIKLDWDVVRSLSDHAPVVAGLLHEW